MYHFFFSNNHKNKCAGKTNTDWTSVNLWLTASPGAPRPFINPGRTNHIWSISTVNPDHGDGYWQQIQKTAKLMKDVFASLLQLQRTKSRSQSQQPSSVKLLLCAQLCTDYLTAPSWKHQEVDIIATPYWQRRKQKPGEPELHAQDQTAFGWRGWVQSWLQNTSS